MFLHTSQLVFDNSTQCHSCSSVTNTNLKDFVLTTLGVTKTTKTILLFTDCNAFYSCIAVVSLKKELQPIHKSETMLPKQEVMLLS